MIDTTSATSPQTRHGVVRCECPNCGIHTMATTDPQTAVCCPNCGARGLVAVGVEPLYCSAAAEQWRRGVQAGLIESASRIGM